MNFNLIVYGDCVCPADWQTYFDVTVRHTVYYCVGGNAYYECNGETVPFEKNHFYIFPMFTKCKLFHDPADPFEVVWFQVNMYPRMVPGICKIAASDGFYRNMVLLLRTAIPKGAQVVAPALNAFLSGCLQDGLIQLSQQDNISTVVNYINDHINEPLGNDTLADLINYNKRYFIALFKEQTGMTPQEYIRSVRYDLATHYLCRGISIKETAALCGFSSPDVLSRNIKAFYGINASDFKLITP